MDATDSSDRTVAKYTTHSQAPSARHKHVWVKVHDDQTRSPRTVWRAPPAMRRVRLPGATPLRGSPANCRIPLRVRRQEDSHPRRKDALDVEARTVSPLIGPPQIQPWPCEGCGAFVELRRTRLHARAARRRKIHPSHGRLTNITCGRPSRQYNLLQPMRTCS